MTNTNRAKGKMLIFLAFFLFIMFIPNAKAFGPGTNYSAVVPIEWNTATVPAVTPPGGGGGGGIWLSSCGNGVCEYPETFINCPTDCDEVWFILEPESGFNFTAVPNGRIACFTIGIFGCPIKVINLGQDNLNVTATISKGEDESYNWSYFINPYGQKTNNATVFVRNNSHNLVAIVVDIPNATALGNYTFYINFTSHDRTRIFRYEITVMRGSIEEIILWLNYSHEVTEEFEWKNWYTVIVALAFIVAIFVLWFSGKKNH